MNISDNIKRIREEKRLSQAEISRKLNLDPSAYFRLEKRGSKLTLDQLESIANALEVTPLELLGLEKPKIENEVGNSELLDLKKRIAELEDRIKDKESIINRYFTELLRKDIVLQDVIMDYIVKKGFDLRLPAQYSKSLNLNAMEQIFEHTYDDKEFIKNIHDNRFIVIFSEEDTKTIIKELLFGFNNYNRGIIHDIISLINFTQDINDIDKVGGYYSFCLSYMFTQYNKKYNRRWFVGGV